MYKISLNQSLIMVFVRLVVTLPEQKVATDLMHNIHFMIIGQTAMTCQWINVQFRAASLPSTPTWTEFA